MDMETLRGWNQHLQLISSHPKYRQRVGKMDMDDPLTFEGVQPVDAMHEVMETASLL